MSILSFQAIKQLQSHNSRYQPSKSDIDSEIVPTSIGLIPNQGKKGTARNRKSAQGRMHRGGYTHPSLYWYQFGTSVPRGFKIATCSFQTETTSQGTGQESQGG
jgi:hypothetical protein